MSVYPEIRALSKFCGVSRLLVIVERAGEDSPSAASFLQEQAMGSVTEWVLKALTGTENRKDAECREIKIKDKKIRAITIQNARSGGNEHSVGRTCVMGSKNGR